MSTRTSTQAPIAGSVPPMSAAGNIRLAVFMALPAMLREFGCDPEAVLGAVGLSPDSIAEPDAFTPFETIDRLLRHCRDATGCEHFGLLLGQRVSLGHLGALGFAMKSAETVATALADLSRYRALHDQSALITLVRDGERVSLRYVLTQSSASAPEQVYDCAIAIGCSLLRDLCGPDWKPSKVMLRRDKPVHTASYEKCFRSPVIYGSEWSGLEFPARWLGVSPAGADPLLYQHMLREMRQLDDAAQGVGADLVASLRLLLFARHCNQREAAALLGVNSRSMRRHLMAAGTTFRAELESARFARAKALLAQPELGALEIAERLGYADLSAFSHAFKRWAGVSPAQWRRSASS
ncbi:MAG: AraC family transcriptional regulator [Halioglobus sp.]|nr:AraC family transcriptional regulator [Halioglobus sp.]